MPQCVIVFFRKLRHRRSMVWGEWTQLGHRSGVFHQLPRHQLRIHVCRPLRGSRSLLNPTTELLLRMHIECGILLVPIVHPRTTTIRSQPLSPREQAQHHGFSTHHLPEMEQRYGHPRNVHGIGSELDDHLGYRYPPLTVRVLVDSNRNCGALVLPHWYTRWALRHTLPRLADPEGWTTLLRLPDQDLYGDGPSWNGECFVTFV